MNATAGSVEKDDKIAKEEKTARSERAMAVAQLKKKSYADTVKLHSETVMNEMGQHLIK